MRAYSGDRAATLQKVRPRHICDLLEIVHDSRLRERAFIASRFADAATHFEDTLDFLEDVGWLRSDNGYVRPASVVTARIVAAEGLQRSLAFAEALFDGAGPYERLFAGYLSKFRCRDGEMVHRPEIEARLRDAGVRDFLMDLGAVTYRADGDCYVLEQPFAPWALWARNVVSPSASQLRQHAQERLELGRGAELAVLDWERQRVGMNWQDRVRHVSEEKPAACFDIQSVTVVGAQAEPRFIEVKAVAADAFEFRWSRPEIEAAEILGPRYFLYLVPVCAQGVFDMGGMEIVQNAFMEVYRNPSKWFTTVADTVCRKRENLDS